SVAASISTPPARSAQRINPRVRRRWATVPAAVPAAPTVADDATVALLDVVSTAAPNDSGSCRQRSDNGTRARPLARLAFGDHAFEQLAHAGQIGESRFDHGQF